MLSGFTFRIASCFMALEFSERDQRVEEMLNLFGAFNRSRECHLKGYSLTKETNKEGIAQKAARATKWSLLTQVISKLISPITTLILAHLMAPEVFGVVSIVTMVTSFADLFSDAGFQKYLIQHEYDDEQRFRFSCDVAFWTNLVISLAIWCCIILTSDQLAAMLGDATIGPAIAVACASLPLTSAVSVQTAVYQRVFDFRTLFYSRIGSSLLILLVSVPMAFAGFGYWSMISGTIASNLLLAIWLTACSEWKPFLRYSWSELKAMFSFSAWTLVEQLSIWLTSWIGTFILGSMMNTYYLGLYNTSTSLVNAVVAIIAGAVNPVVFATLSRFQNDREKFDSAFYRMQKYLGLAIAPMSVALGVFSNAAVGLYLGDAWLETAPFLGLYSLASAFVVVFGHIASDAYRALGKPKWSLLAQISFLVLFTPGLYIGASQGYAVLSWIVPLFRLVGCLATHFFICKSFMHLSPLRMITNMKWVYLVTFIVAVPSSLLIWWLNLNYMAQCVLFAIDVILFLLFCIVFKDTRETLFDLARRFGIMDILIKLVPARLLDNDVPDYDEVITK